MGYEIQGGNEACPELTLLRRSGAGGRFPGLFVLHGRATRRGARQEVVAPFDESGLLAKAPYALPAAHGVVKLVGSVKNPRRPPPAARQLQARLRPGPGGRGGAAPGARVARLANLLCFDASGGADPRDFLDRAKGRQVILLAARVRGLEQFEALRAAGFTLFQGPFFKEPEILAERKLTSHQMSRFTLLRLIEAEDPDVDALAEGISADVSVSFRLLSYLNSAAFGFSQKIRPSARHHDPGLCQDAQLASGRAAGRHALHGDMPRTGRVVAARRDSGWRPRATFGDFRRVAVSVGAFLPCSTPSSAVPMAKVTTSAAGENSRRAVAGNAQRIRAALELWPVSRSGQDAAGPADAEPGFRP